MRISACCLFLLLVGCQGSTTEKVCDFAGLPALRASDWVDGNVVQKVEPKYPQEAIERGLSGRVVVRILVNKEGRVERACSAGGEGTSAEPLLVAAATEAATQWRFRPNFGFSAPLTSKYEYIDASLVFDFTLPPDGQESKHGKN